MHDLPVGAVTDAANFGAEGLLIKINGPGCVADGYVGSDGMETFGDSLHLVGHADLLGRTV